MSSTDFQEAVVYTVAVLLELPEVDINAGSLTQWVSAAHYTHRLARAGWVHYECKLLRLNGTCAAHIFVAYLLTSGT